MIHLPTTHAGAKVQIVLFMPTPELLLVKHTVRVMNDLKRSFFVGRAYTSVAKPILSFQLKDDGPAGKVGETALPHVAREQGQELDTTLEAGDPARVNQEKQKVAKVRPI